MSGYAEDSIIIPGLNDPSQHVPAAPQFGSGSVGVAVAVVDPDQGERTAIASIVPDGATTFASVTDLASRLTGVPVVVVLGPSCASDHELAAVSAMTAEHREVGVILIADELSTALLQTALRSGVKDVLGAPVDSAGLAGAIHRVGDGLAQMAVPSAAPVGRQGEEDLDPSELGRVITVFSTKGGAGKSVIASNLAVSLAQQSDRPVVLVDAHLQFGDLAVMLKLAPQHTIVDAVSVLDKLDVNLLTDLLAHHEPSGLKVLPAPLEPAFADQIGGEEISQIISLLRRYAGHIVIDTPAYFNEVVLALIEESDDVVLVAGMDIPNIKNVKLGLQTLRLLNTPMEKIHLVLNRANSKVKLEVSEVEKTLAIKAEALIPSDRDVPISVNKGTPVILGSPRSGVSKALEEFANTFVAQGAAPSAEQSSKKRWR
ncbi:MAG: P-loop NTPase [Actinomycetia bacterium]|nr:P-loop NTPase [Actinomycetes bacterium]